MKSWRRLPPAVFCSVLVWTLHLAADDESPKGADPGRVLLILHGDLLTEARGKMKGHTFNDEQLESVFSVGPGSAGPVAVLLELRLQNASLTEIIISRTETKSRVVEKMRTLTPDHYGENFKAIYDRLNLAAALPAAQPPE
jgi:hypothetical protein